MTTIDQPFSLAVAISLYDRWDELQGLLELLRHNWTTGPSLFIAVTSTAEKDAMPDWVNRGLADQFVFGSVIKLPARKSSKFQLLHDRRYGFFKKQLRTRTVDCVRRACKQCLASGKRYTLHLHSAAWPLKEKKIYEILSTVHRSNYMAAGRGYGKKLVDGKHPAGDIDDNFFIIDNDFAKRTSFWDLDPARDADVMAAEGQIARRLEELGVFDRVYFYDDFSQARDYIYPPEADQRRVQPYNYHKPTGLLRSHDMHWQATLCAELGIRGPYLDKLIAQELSTEFGRGR